MIQRFPPPPRVRVRVRAAGQVAPLQGPTTSDIVGISVLAGIGIVLYLYTTGPAKRYQAEDRRRLGLD